MSVNLLTPNDDYSGRTTPLTSKRCILYIYSTHIGTEYFKRGKYSPFFSSSKCSLFHNSNIFGSWIIHILYTECAKIKKKNSGAKRLKLVFCFTAAHLRPRSSFSEVSRSHTIRHTHTHMPIEII